MVSAAPTVTRPPKYACKDCGRAVSSAEVQRCHGYILHVARVEYASDDEDTAPPAASTDADGVAARTQPPEGA